MPTPQQQLQWMLYNQMTTPPPMSVGNPAEIPMAPQLLSPEEEQALLEQQNAPTPNELSLLLQQPLSKKPVSREMIQDAFTTEQRAKVQEALNRQLGGVENQQTNLATLQEQLRESPAVDLSPMLAQASNLLGQDLLRGYTKPMTKEERLKMVTDLQKEIQKGQEGLTEAELGLLKSNLMDKSIIEQGKTARFETAQETRLFNQVRKEQEKLVKEAGDFRTNLGAVESAITPDKDGMVSVGRVNQALSRFARIMGESGALAESDIGRQLTPTIDRYIANFSAMLTSNPGAKIPFQNVKEIEEALEASKQAFTEVYTTKANIFTEGYFQNPGSPYAGKTWSSKMVADTYKPLQMIKMKQVPQQGGPVGQQVDPRKQRLEELRAKYKGK